MPALFDIRSEKGDYSVVLERNGLDAALPRMRQDVVIADEHFAQKLAAQGVHAIALPANEHTKSLDEIGAVIVKLREAGANRSSHLWAVGGGVIQDVAGFVSSIYMRGISWTYLPTTLLGMADSCIGGKSSINVGAYKNIVGTFNVPQTVLIDPSLTATLSAEQRVAGLVEAAKICFCRDNETFARYMALSPTVGMAAEAFEPVIGLSLGAKKWFIETDEFDHAERLLLNFGHTFGHALEGASHYRLSHGVAVGVGILCSLDYSHAQHGHAFTGRALELERHLCALLAEVPDLADILRAIDVPEALDRLKSDKKHEAEHYRFVTVDEHEQLQLVRIAKSSAQGDALIAAAISRAVARLSA